MPKSNGQLDRIESILANPPQSIDNFAAFGMYSMGIRSLKRKA